AADELPDARAVSLSMLDRDVDRSDLAGAVLRELSARLRSWRTADPALASDYRSVSTTIGNRVRAILPNDTEIIGTAIDVDDAGRLLIDSAGTTVTVS